MIFKMPKKTLSMVRLVVELQEEYLMLVLRWMIRNMNLKQTMAQAVYTVGLKDLTDKYGSQSQF